MRKTVEGTFVNRGVYFVKVSLGSKVTSCSAATISVTKHVLLSELVGEAENAGGLGGAMIEGSITAQTTS